MNSPNNKVISFLRKNLPQVAICLVALGCIFENRAKFEKIFTAFVTATKDNDMNACNRNIVYMNREVQMLDINNYVIRIVTEGDKKNVCVWENSGMENGQILTMNLHLDTDSGIFDVNKGEPPKIINISQGTEKPAVETANNQNTSPIGPIAGIAPTAIDTMNRYLPNLVVE